MVVRNPRYLLLAGVLVLHLATGLAAQGGCGSISIGTFYPSPGLQNAFPMVLEVHDSGGGPTLHVGGYFSYAFGASASGIARWDGNAWSALGSGVTTTSPKHPIVTCMASFDDGGGPALFVGGSFQYAGGAQSNNIARWNGLGWTQLGNGLPGYAATYQVRALLAYDDGSGPALYAGGRFNVSTSGAPADHVARWDGSAWWPVGMGSNSHVNVFAVFDDGTGAALYAGGGFTSIGGVSATKMARWDGASWFPVGGGVTGGISGNKEVWALEVFDDGTGPALFAGGHFTHAGGQPADGIAKWDGANWTPLGPGPSASWGGPPEVWRMQVLDDGLGPALYVSGHFDMLGGLPIPMMTSTHGLARWDGSSWSLVPSLPDGGPMAVFDDGASVGPDLFVGLGGVTLSSPFSVHRVSCTGTTSISTTQPGGPGTPLNVTNANLSPGREYYNIFSVEIVGLPGSGPFLGLHASPGPNLDFLILQALLPVGTPPFHFFAPASYQSWGPFPLGPATIDAVCFDFTGGTLGAVSPVVRITIL